MFDAHLEHEINRYIEDGLRPEYRKGLSFSSENEECPQAVQEDGNSIENAIIINAPNSVLGVPKEYEYIESICGKKDKCWKLELQESLAIKNRFYDKITIKMYDGKEKKFYFDITDFYGKL